GATSFVPACNSIARGGPSRPNRGASHPIFQKAGFDEFLFLYRFRQRCWFRRRKRMLTVSSPQVLISGAGADGLAAALELRRFGIPVRIIEAQEGPSKTSRAIGVQARTLEELELRGLASEFVRLGNPAKGGTIYGDGRQLLRLDFTRIESRYNFLLLLSEADTERIMREALAREGTRVEFGVKMVAFAQNAEGITATLEHTGGRLEEISAAYLIDAEGAHSLIRTSLNLEFKGKTLDEHYALGDLHLVGDLPFSNLHIFSSEYGFMGLFPLAGSHFGLIARIPREIRRNRP